MCSSLVMLLGVFFISKISVDNPIDQAIILSIPFIRLLAGISDLRLHEKINKRTTKYAQKTYAATEFLWGCGVAIIGAFIVLCFSYELSIYVFIMIMAYKSSTSSKLYNIRYNRQFSLLLAISFTKLIFVGLTYLVMKGSMSFNEYVLCTEIITIYYLLFGFNRMILNPMRLIKLSFRRMRAHVSINVSKSLRSNIEVLALILLKAEDAILLRTIIESSLKFSQPFGSVLTYFRNNIYHDYNFSPLVFGLIFVLLGACAEILILSSYYVSGMTLLAISFMYLSAFLRAADLRRAQSQNIMFRSCILLFDLIVVFAWFIGIGFYQVFLSVHSLLAVIPLVLVPAYFILVYGYQPVKSPTIISKAIK